MCYNKKYNPRDVQYISSSVHVTLLVSLELYRLLVTIFLTSVLQTTASILATTNVSIVSLHPYSHLTMWLHVSSCLLSCPSFLSHPFFLNTSPKYDNFCFDNIESTRTMLQFAMVQLYLSIILCYTSNVSSLSI